MVIKEKLVENEINNIVAATGFRKELILKDYYITILLYLMKDIKGIYFKGGTALQLTLLNHARISEDIDFTINRPLQEVREEIKHTINNSGLFGKITQDKDVEKFVRLIIPYESILGKDKIFIDLNEKGNLLLEPEHINMNHFYPNIPHFSFPCLNSEEMVAEKVAAAIGRNKPRDHYDIYKLIKHQTNFNMELVRKKCEQAGSDPSIIKMFDRAQKLHKIWNEDMLPLLVEEVGFKEVMRTLAEQFNLKEEKEKLKE